MNLEITLTEEGNRSIITLAGEIDAYTAPDLKETFGIVTKKAGQEVIVDLEHVTYMDSTGLGLFIGALKSTKENDSELKLVNLQDRVYRLFQITGLDEIMDIKAAIRGGNE